MLQVKDLRKTYKMNKTKQEFGALKGVSLDFPNKGFVFIIGKSGSGKSTLLNLLGGLDKPDGGEIIIKGKSSKSFTSKDFDSYRNTYLGFVFQEFNLLEHYTIEENIKLALELQSYKGNLQQKSNEILKTVDLFDKRLNKINQISGGQKQRVAIARALIKDPEIILADEPTGNLDSETSEVVMETLQKLSKDKLVIMVTHDVDYASKYADRVIELKDGQVLTDVSRTVKYHGETGIIEGSQSGIEKVIRLPKSGYLEPDTISKINEIARSNGEKNLYMTLSFDEDKVTSIDPSAKILSTQYQDEKEEVKLTYENESNFKLIKSKLPFKNSLKMAGGNIWRKKLRNLFILLILVGAMFMFGFAETVNRYDYGNVVANTFSKGNINLVHVTNGKEYTYTMGNTGGLKGGPKMTTSGNYTFTDAEIANLSNEFKSLQFYKVFDINTPNPLYTKQTEVVQPSTTMYRAANVAQLSDLGIPNDRITKGTFPVTANDVLISDLVAPYLKNELGTEVQVGDKIHNTNFVVSGIYQSNVLDTFPYLKDLSLEDYSSELKASQQDAWNTYRSILSMFIVNDQFYAKYKEETNVYTTINNDDAKLMSANKAASFNQPTVTLSTYSELGFIKDASKFKRSYDTSITSLNKGEVIINATFLKDYLGKQDLSDVTFPLNIQLKSTALAYAKVGSIADENIKEYTVRDVFEYCSMQDIYDKVQGCENVTPYDNKQMIFGTPTEVGMIVNSEDMEVQMNFVSLYTKLGYNINENAKFFNYAREHKFTYTSTSMTIINMFDAIVKALGAVFKFISIVLAVFAAILLFQNISASVLAKKKEIGTLRAIGARGLDVAKIFVIEAVIITLLTGLIGTYVLMNLSNYLNNYISNSLGFALSLFNVTWVIVLELLALSVFLGVLAALLPSYKVAKMKPIDAIKDK